MSGSCPGVPIHSVVGNPILLEKVEQPTDEQVDKAHAQYVKELQRIYAEFKDTYAEEREKALNRRMFFLKRFLTLGEAGHA